MPVLGQQHCRAQHFPQAVIGRQYRFCLGCLSALTVEALNRMRGINQSPHLLRIFEGFLLFGAKPFQITDDKYPPV